MAKITNPDDLDVGVELTLDTAAQTFTLNVAGTLVAKDGVTLQALYSKFVDLWTTSAYNKFAFPMYTIDAKSGQYQFGTDGATYSGWKPANDATRQMLRDGGWSEFSAAGVLNRQYVGIVSLGDVNAGAQLYYQRVDGGTATDFTFDDAANEGIQVYGDATNGSFDTRTYFKAYVREYAKKYDDSILGDTGQTATGAYTVNMLVSNEDDLKIQDTDGNVAANLPYTGITATWITGTGFTTATVSSLVAGDVRQDTAGRWFICTAPGTVNAAGVANYTLNGGTATLAAYTGEREIGGSYYPFSIIVDGNGAIAEDIYTKIQYLLRQNSDIDSGAGSRIGSITQNLMGFVGDTLITTTGVYIDDYDTNDVNRLTFTDSTDAQRTEPYTATGTLNFNPALTSGGAGYYRMYFTELAGANDYGLTGAITVQNTTGADIQGTISGASIPFTFDYDGNVQGGRTPATNAGVTVVAGNAGSAKPVVVNYTITRSTGQGITLTAETDRAYL
ncbi:MAG: hypothetical protein ACRC5T_03550 [Cetobacterium sp.]